MSQKVVDPIHCWLEDPEALDQRIRQVVLPDLRQTENIFKKTYKDTGTDNVTRHARLL